MVRALRPPRRGRRRGARLRGVEPFGFPGRHPVPRRHGLLPPLLDRDPAPEPAPRRVAERPVARSGDGGDRGPERHAAGDRRDRIRSSGARPVRRRVPRGGRAVPDRRRNRVPRARASRGPARDRGRRRAAHRRDRHDAVPVPSPRIGDGPGERRVLRGIRADHRLGRLGLRCPGARTTQRGAPRDVPRGLRDVSGCLRVRGAVAERIVRGRTARGRPADRVRRPVRRGARQRHPSKGDRTAQGSGPVRQGRPDDRLGRRDQRRPRTGRGRQAQLGDRRSRCHAPDRLPGGRGRAPHPREPGPRNAVAARGPRRARPEGGRPPRDGPGPVTAPARERDPARVRGTPPHRVRVRGRRHRRARPPRRRRPRERRLLQDGRAPAVARRRSAVELARRLDPERRAVRLAAGDRAGDAPARGSRHLPRIEDLGDPRRPTPAAAPGPRRDGGPGGRPDDPLVVQIPAGPRRGPDADHATDQRGDRGGAQPHRSRPARRAGAGGLCRIALARGGAPHAEGRRDRRWARHPVQGALRALGGGGQPPAADVRTPSAAPGGARPDPGAA